MGKCVLFWFCWTDFCTGKPVIITAVEPFTDFYKHKKEVYFISKKNSSKDLANGFIELFKNPSLRKFIGNTGKEYSRKNYSLIFLGTKISNFLKKIRNKNIT